MADRYWLVRPDGGRHPVDPNRCDLEQLAERARRLGARLVVEHEPAPDAAAEDTRRLAATARRAASYEPPVTAIGPLFRRRLGLIHEPETPFDLEVNARATSRVLGGYYRRRRLVRIYTHDRETGRRPLEELFDTFLHEVAHHLEYTEPHRFNARACGRVPGRMHSQLFWRILGELKVRWIDLQQAGEGRV